MKKQLHDYKGYTAFERLDVSDDKTNPKINLDKNDGERCLLYTSPSPRDR